MKYKKYRTKAKDGSPAYIVKICVDSVDRFWIASTNDFEFYDKYLDNLNYKPKDEAQADLDKIALERGLEEGYEQM